MPDAFSDTAGFLDCHHVQLVLHGLSLLATERVTILKRLSVLILHLVGPFGAPPGIQMTFKMWLSESLITPTSGLMAAGSRYHLDVEDAGSGFAYSRPC